MKLAHKPNRFASNGTIVIISRTVLAIATSQYACVRAPWRPRTRLSAKYANTTVVGRIPIADAATYVENRVRAKPAAKFATLSGTTGSSRRRSRVRKLVD